LEGNLKCNHENGNGSYIGGEKKQITMEDKFAMQTYFLGLFNFDYWANKKLLSAMQEAGFLPERVKNIYSHLLATTQIWHGRLIGIKTEVAVWENFPQDNWLTILEENKIRMETYLKDLTEETFNTGISYTNSKGLAFYTLAEDILTHMIAHSNYHQGQIVAGLKPILATLPDINYITYCREKQEV